MPLARIITRSQACSRELALDLLARGYAVEVVSPDNIPDNIADLELRVDDGPGDQLTASVKAHDGERTASLDFVHHLKSPMGDFIRRKPEPRQTIPYRQIPVTLGVEPTLEDGEFPAEAPRPLPLPDSQAAVAVDAAVTDFAKNDFAKTEPAKNDYATDDLEKDVIVIDAAPTEASAISPADVSPEAPVRRQVVAQTHGSPQLFGRTLMMIAAVALVTLVLGFGLIRIEKASARNSSGPVDKSSPDKTSALSATSTLSPSNPLHQAPAATATASAPTAGPVSVTDSTKPPGELVARDTVTYLDKKYDPRSPKRIAKKPAPKPAATGARRASAKRRIHRRSSATRNGIVAANTVTYLNSKPVARTAKTDSAVKHISDLR